MCLQLRSSLVHQVGVQVKFLALFVGYSQDQWNCEIVHCYVALPLQQWISVWACVSQIVWRLLTSPDHLSMHLHKKFWFNAPKHTHTYTRTIHVGQAGWGITWYINGTLIPELIVERGKTYTFIVEGGTDPNNLAVYHPFYITDSIGGGRLQNTQQEQEVCTCV